MTPFFRTEEEHHTNNDILGEQHLLYKAYILHRGDGMGVGITNGVRSSSSDQISVAAHAMCALVVRIVHSILFRR